MKEASRGRSAETASAPVNNKALIVEISKTKPDANPTASHGPKRNGDSKYRRIGSTLMAMSAAQWLAGFECTGYTNNDVATSRRFPTVFAVG